MDDKTSESHSATLPDLLIRYKNSAGEETEREIKQVRVPVPEFIYASCQMEQAERAFKISRIKSAVDLSTGEVIQDLYAFLGVPRPESSPPESLPLTTAEIKRRRKKEKWDIYRDYHFEIIRDHINRLFFGLFDNRCYKCSAFSLNNLVMDHHIPVSGGGHFTPGNLVALCIWCNNKKSDILPETFYTPEELERLQPLLARQGEIFSFKLDWNVWEADHEGYLLSLGIDPLQVHEALHNEQHPFYIRYTNVTYTLELTDDQVIVRSKVTGLNTNSGAADGVPTKP